MRITDTLDQLLRTLVTSSPADEAFPAPIDGPPDRTGVDSGSNGDPGYADFEATAEATPAATDKAPANDRDSRAPLEIAATQPRTPQDTDLERIEVTAKVAESLNLGFHLGFAVDRIAVAAIGGSEGDVALRQAAWLIKRYVDLLEHKPIGADSHASSVGLARTDDLISDLRGIADQLESEPASMQIVPLAPAPVSEPAAALIAPRVPEPEPQPEPEAVPGPTLEVAEHVWKPAAAQIISFEPTRDELEAEPAAAQIIPFEPAPVPEPEPVQSSPSEPEPASVPAAAWSVPLEPEPEPEPEAMEPGPAPEQAEQLREPAAAQIIPFEPAFETTSEAEQRPEPGQILSFAPAPVEPLLEREPEPEQIIPFGPALERYEPEPRPDHAQSIHFEPAPEPTQVALRPQATFVQSTAFSTAVENGSSRSTAPRGGPDELPPLRHELFITAVRAFVALAAVTLLVLMLTLIAQWH